MMVEVTSLGPTPMTPVATTAKQATNGSADSLIMPLNFEKDNHMYIATLPRRNEIDDPQN